MALTLPAFSAYGIELEYMLVDRSSLDVRPMADRILVTQKNPAQLVDCSNELVNHVLEIKNPHPTALEVLTGAFQQQVRDLNARLADFDACLMPTAMHPWLDPARETQLWPHDSRKIYATFDALFDCKRHPWANVQSMHINLPFANDDQFEKLLAAARVLLPILPAIAASSPLAGGVATGYLDYRMHVYPEQSRSQPRIAGEVIPEVVKSKSEYESQVLEPLYADLEAHDPLHTLRFEWLNARGAIPRFDRNALEIRVMDVQECPQADIALAALTVDAANALYQGQFANLQAQQSLPTSLLSGLLASCSRDAELTWIDDAQYLAVWGLSCERCTAKELWNHLGEALERNDAQHMPLWRTHLQFIAQQGPLGRRILRAVENNTSAQDLHTIYRELANNLQSGTMFLP